MRFFSIPALFLCLAFMLSACAEKWEKKDATDRDFEALQASCEATAYKAFPPHVRPVEMQPGYTTPLTSQCSQTPYAVNCMQHGGDYVSPAVLNVDDNADAREAEVRSCYAKHGWKPAANQDSLF